MPRRLKLSTRARDVKPSLHTAPPTKTEQSATVERSMARQVAELPPDQLAIVVNSLKENAKPGVIANFFAEQGWLTVSEKTFRQYIMAFRRIYPEAVRGHGEGMDSHVDPRNPHLDEEDVLDQLIRVQKVRIGRALDFEKNTNLPMKDIHKDVIALKDIVEARARLRGGAKGAGNKSGNTAALSNEANEALRKSDTAETSQERMTHLTTMLVPLMRAKAKSGDA